VNVCWHPPPAVALVTHLLTQSSRVHGDREAIVRPADATLAEQDDDRTVSRPHMGPEYSLPAGNRAAKHGTE
jgi:hypothetical protein